jgi:hypothetical protein
MFKTKQFRAQAGEYRKLGNSTNVPNEAREFQKLEQSFTVLADNEQWLADNHDKTVRAPEQDRAEDTTLTVEEENVLRCLGAALIMQLNTLPTKLKSELFNRAGLMGDLLQTAQLRGQIARFLHKHKGEEI